VARYAQWTILTATPGQRDELAGHALEMAELARTAPGCETFAVCISPSQPTVVLLFELFETRQSHDALAALEQTSQIARRTMTLLAEPPEQIELTVIDR
jgi:quinol monooxygenase YgiN